MARLIWAEPALQDLDTIADYIALDKPEAAKRLVRRVFAAVERLRKFPKSGAKLPELPRLLYRQVVVPPVRVIYRFYGGTVHILHVMRGETLLREDTLRVR